MIKNKNISFCLNVISSAFLILSGGSIFFVFNRNICTLILFFSVLCLFFFHKKQLSKKVFQTFLLSISLFSFLIFINYVFSINTQSIKKYFFLLFSFFISSFYLLHYLRYKKKEDYLIYIYIVLKIIMFHSLINFLLFFLLPSSSLNLLSSDLLINNYQCKTFGNLFFYLDRNIIEVSGIKFCRNQGLFWEPGVLQIYLNLLFFIEAFLIKRSKYILLLTSFALLFCYSSTGLVLLVLQLFFYLKSNLRRNLLLVPLILILTIPIVQITNLNVKDKISGEGFNSTLKRNIDLVQPFLLALDNPLTGVGLDDQMYVQEKDKYEIKNENAYEGSFGRGTSNSITFIFAILGFPTALMFLFFIFNHNFIDNRLLFNIILLLSLASEPIIFKPFCLIFLASGMYSFLSKFVRNNKS